MNELLLYTGGALTMLWGISHLFPTRQVVRGFGSITRDNRLVLTMEWIAEAILLIFTGALVVFTTARFGADGAAPETTFAGCAVMLLTVGAHLDRGISLARVPDVPHRGCLPIATVHGQPGALTSALLSRIRASARKPSIRCSEWTTTAGLADPPDCCLHP